MLVSRNITLYDGLAFFSQEIIALPMRQQTDYIHQARPTFVFDCLRLSD
jgi:hypothetical protein